MDNIVSNQTIEEPIVFNNVNIGTEVVLQQEKKYILSKADFNILIEQDKESLKQYKDALFGAFVGFLITFIGKIVKFIINYNKMEDSEKLKLNSNIESIELYYLSIAFVIFLVLFLIHKWNKKQLKKNEKYKLIEKIKNSYN
ncbi:hypothetical protein HMPREF9714_02280 [Myroides odoratimimus CCUG 12901]|uniref:hypothetical protein n=1 Tax=Myroides odoratimimus TaxID=76832 RepID=UPI0002461710|nr:hypothetical protein [Myroides odoratimimus]EHO08257.1 hypothetical protein HMPREF9714_02280 [Myroides odoratimimus CCUG 12901]EKB05662.1 hypothetical protein HMPREF9711_01041 [Myroides odoratimimus CCUG 3837]